MTSAKRNKAKTKQINIVGIWHHSSPCIYTYVNLNIQTERERERERCFGLYLNNTPVRALG